MKNKPRFPVGTCRSGCAVLLCLCCLLSFTACGKREVPEIYIPPATNPLYAYYDDPEWIAIMNAPPKLRPADDSRFDFGPLLPFDGVSDADPLP